MSPSDDQARVPPPIELRPMLALLRTALPTGEDWAYEMKWDGIRAFVVAEGGSLRVMSRNGNDVSAAYPELSPLAGEVDADVMLDGEIVAVDEHGRPSFQLLQRRMHLRDPNEVRRIARRTPVTFMSFDVVWMDGRPTTALPYRDRRGLLDTLKASGPAWQTPPTSVGDGPDALRRSRELGFEGVVAKRLDSRYEPGRRSGAWCKVKHQQRQEFVVGGWTSGEGARHATIGALLVGYHDAAGRLQFAGKVGTGFTRDELERLDRLLAPLAQDTNPFAGSLPVRGAHFVRPELVAEVRFLEWTGAGRVRQPAYLGLRNDVDPAQVVREG